MKKMKWLALFIIPFLFISCAVKDTTTNTFEGKVSLIGFNKVAGMDVAKMQKTYRLGFGLSGFALNSNPKEFDVEVGDYVQGDSRTNSIKVIKANGTKRIYYFDKDDNITDIKELN